MAIDMLTQAVAKRLAGGGGSAGLPEGGEPYKQLVTDADGKTVWEDRLAYKHYASNGSMGGSDSMTWTAEGDRYISTSDVKLNEELVIGDTYIVMVDGVHYAVEAKTVQGMPALGNTKVAGFGEDTGEPFCLVDMGGEYCYIVSSVQAKLFNVSKGTVTVKPIDPEYMPASVGTLRIVVTENDDDTFSSSHTYDEIMEALIAGKNVECLYGFDVLQLSNCAQLANAVTYAVSLDILFNTVNWTRQIIYIKITKTNRITKKVLDIPYEVTDDHINELIDAKLEQIGSAEGVSY